MISVYAPRFPLGTLILNSLVGPSILRSLMGTTMFELNAEPDVCLQSQQWHKTYPTLTLMYRWIRRPKISITYLVFVVATIRDGDGGFTTETSTLNIVRHDG